MTKPGVLFLAALAAIPAAAQVNLSGEWAARQHEDQLERAPGPAVGDYLGLPINAAARMRANSWQASLLEIPEEQRHRQIAPAWATPPTERSTRRRWMPHSCQYPGIYCSWATDFPQPSQAKLMTDTSRS